MQSRGRPEADTQEATPVQPKPTVRIVQCPHCGSFLEMLPEQVDEPDIARCAGCDAYFHTSQARRSGYRP